ncbi:hypothetical protein BaRGS_00005839 [Batillaria attramentaria]|uniref:Lipid droplet-associated hydrolase n=1 Tax=Batillaria attramentaria TaxID=370345 RepID=A0ABD0LUI6_9CAEN
MIVHFFIYYTDLMASTHPPKPRQKSSPRTNDQLPPVKVHTAQTSDPGKKTVQRGVFPLATAGNYSHILSTMDAKTSRQKKQLSSLRTSPMKFATSMNGHTQPDSGHAVTSGPRPASASSRGSRKVVLPKLQDSGDCKYVAEGQGEATKQTSTQAAEVNDAVNGAHDEQDGSHLLAKGRLTAEEQTATQADTKVTVKQEPGQSGVEACAQNDGQAVTEQKMDGKDQDADSDGEQAPAKSEQELEEAAKKKLDALSELYKKTATIEQRDEDGSYTTEFKKSIEAVRLSYFKFKKYPLRIMQESRDEAGKLLMKSGMVPILCDVVVAGLESGNYLSSEGKIVQNFSKPLHNAMQTLMNFSDACDDLTIALRYHEQLLPVVLKKIREWYPGHMDKTLKRTEDTLLKNCLSVVHNIAMRDDNIERFRQLHASDTLLLYLDSHDEGVKLAAVASLADIVTEQEADKLATSSETAHFLLNRLKRALKHKTHRFKGWSVEELVRAVRQLARNDANKRLLVEEGALPLLTEGVQSSFVDEKTECMQCLWVMSFDKRNADEMLASEQLMEEVVLAFEDHSLPKVCRHSAQGILWQLRDELVKTEKYRCVGEKFQNKVHTDKTSEVIAGKSSTVPGMPAGHVMLSYQWADQETVKQIRDELQAKGFRVWMDIDNMGGSTLQAMAEAIEEAFVVLMCMSQKYKDSPNCRAEAEYAFQQRKKIIPLIMQQGYRPDGWLGMILGAKLYYDFSGKYSFESRIMQLIKAVRESAGMLTSSDSVDGPSAERPPPQALSPGRLEIITAWTRSDVHDWLKKHKLDGTELEKLTGREIIFLYNLRSEAPEFFYNTLERKLQIITLPGLICFTDALNDLPQRMDDRQPVKSEYIDVGGVETHVLRAGSLPALQSRGESVRHLFLVIPGNPGIPEYYEQFMQTLWEKSNRQIPVWCVGHAGHVTGPNVNSLGWTEIVQQPDEAYTLEGQITHKVNFIKQHVPADVRLILIGHSIGCYMILNLLPRIPQFNIVRCFMLFPTIERMANSPNGRVFTPALNYLRWILVGTVKLLSYLSQAVHLKLVRYHFRDDPVPDCAVKASLNLFNPACVNYSTFLAKQEMAFVSGLQLDLLKQHMDKISFYYGAVDKWCPQEYCHEMQARFPDADIRLCQMDFSHAFVLDAGEEMAHIIWDWVQAHI